MLDAGAACHLVGDLGPVAAHERDVLDAGIVELSRQRVGPGTEPVAHHDHRHEGTVDTHEDLRAARAVAGVLGPRVVVCAGVAVRLEPAARADGDPVPFDDAENAPAGILLDAGGKGELETSRCRPDHEALGEHVGRHLVERGREPQRLVWVERSERDDALELGLPEGERAGLVEQHRLRPAEPLERAGALDDDAGPGRPREACDERDRRREDERAGGRHDHDGETAPGVPRGEPGEACDCEREGEEVRGVAIREPGELGPVGLGGLDEPHDRGVRALRRRGGDAEIEGVAGVRRPGADMPVAGDRDGQRLSRQRRLVDDGLVADDRAVGRDDVPGPHRHDVAGLELLDPDLLHHAVDVPVCDARGPLDEEAELAPGPAGGPGLERRAAGHHQGDDGGGEELAEREGPDDRHEGDRVDADVSAEQRARGGDHERDEHRDRPDGPGDVRPALRPEQPERYSGDDRAEGDRGQAALA